MNEEKIMRLAPKFALAALSFSFLAVMMFWFAYITEDSPLWYPNDPFPIEEGVIKKGETLSFYLNRCSDGLVNYDFSQRFERLDEHQSDLYIDSGNATAQGDCTGYWSKPKLIPEMLPPGDYRMLFDVTAHGKFKEHTFLVRTQKFKIIE